SPADYGEKLARAHVLVDLEERKKRIRAGLAEAANRTGAKLVEDEPLVETTANLVEFPVVLQGCFEKKYLALPREILVSTMRNNQKYFVFEDDQKALVPFFAFVSNMVVPDEQVVASGNERVLRSRLSDAEFYYWDDLKTPLFERAEALKKVLFQADMGTYWEKTERMAEVAAFVASFDFPEKAQDCRRAAFLSKADLTTGVVKEFPELQGVMGRHYALKTGETEEISESIFEHYLPKGQSDDLPAADIGAAVAIADKIDMVCGCFGVGLIPTGTADPYALRRHTLGILSILEARGLRIKIEELVGRSLSTLFLKLKFPVGEVRQKVMEFFAARYLNLQVSHGIPADIVEAVIAAGMTDMVDLRSKLDALNAFRLQEAFEPLAEVFKRVINITKTYSGPLEVSERFFDTPEEKALYAASHGVSERVYVAARDGRYEEAFREMAALQPLVAAFFDNVLVMAEDEAVRNNRLAMLKGLSAMFSSVADFSKILSSGQQKPA
ncbi:MAG: glycine--tRNA ligase subunit beta, partial [Syntrophorhabdaceae bacterium]|nr:glycine--tRNA ligase subunit beta [Syntrophorhabdaceae bacterium]